jgi:hypothetical protein
MWHHNESGRSTPLRDDLMSRIVLDESLRQQLAEADSPVELCDHSGRVLGYFVPASGFFVLPEDECPYSADELRRMQAETGGTTLAELWQELGRT